jgi:hypothetical protein
MEGEEMKGTPQRQHLEEALKDERVGSTKIQALGDYASLKDVEWRTEHRPAVIDELDGIQLIIEKAVVEKLIELRHFQADVCEYMEALENAEDILKPYVAIDNTYTSPYQLFLDDLEEINMEKSKKIIATLFLRSKCYNAAMKKGRIKEENVAKISITAKRAEDIEDVIKLEKLMAKKKRMRIN